MIAPNASWSGVGELSSSVLLSSSVIVRLDRIKVVLLSILSFGPDFVFKLSDVLKLRLPVSSCLSGLSVPWCQFVLAVGNSVLPIMQQLCRRTEEGGPDPATSLLQG